MLGLFRHKKRFSPIEFLILFGLNGRNLSGYALMESIAEESGGRIRLKAGTLYPALKRLADEKKWDPPLIFYDEKAKEFGLTDTGRKLLAVFPEQFDSAFEASEHYLAFIIKRGGPKHYKAMCDRMLSKHRTWAFPWVCTIGKEINQSKEEQLQRLNRVREQLTKRLEQVDQQIKELKRGNKRGKT